MRVAYISWAPFVSGAERSLQTMLRYVPEFDIDPLVVCPLEAKIIPWCKANQVPFAICPLALRDKWHPLRWWESRRKMRALLAAHQVDLVHSNQVYSYPAAGAAARDLGLPRVCHMRDELAGHALRWFCSAGVEALICISRYIESQIAAGWSRAPRPSIGTLLNPVVLPELPSCVEQRDNQLAARRRLSINEDAVLFGFLGQIVPIKGLLTLLQALSGLVADPRWKLLIAGRDPQPGAPHEHTCRERVKHLGLEGRVRFLGFLEDVSDFYQAIDVAVVPSLEEPLGRIPLEAAAHARPAIASAVGGLPETIRDGETGWLVPGGDPQRLSETLKSCLDGLSPDIGLAAREWIAKISDPRRYCENLRLIYRRLLAHEAITDTDRHSCCRQPCLEMP
jgi:glycosyltransferase involved in cell wall biosynthesis